VDAGTADGATDDAGADDDDGGPDPGDGGLGDAGGPACEPPSADRCGGACTDLASDPDNCGECGEACEVANGTAVCTDGECGIESCTAGFDDCDSDPANGCEAELAVDALHCGSCGTECAWGCSDGACTDPVAISAGYYHTCALLPTGEVACWGSNRYGQLGDGTTTNSTTPLLVTGLTDAAAIDLGDYHSCALRSSGRAVCWGWNYFGTLGDGTTTDRSIFVEVPLSGVAEVRAGGKRTCARLTSGALRCWGNGLLGDGGSYGMRPTPVAVSGIADATALAVGEYHACAMRSSGQVGSLRSRITAARGG
jgi:hypothetical protein